MTYEQARIEELERRIEQLVKDIDETIMHLNNRIDRQEEWIMNMKKIGYMPKPK